MRILLINEFAEGYGAEQIVKDQAELLSQNGHEVLQLCFGFKSGQKRDVGWEDDTHIIITSPACFKILFDIVFYRRIRRVVKSFRPDKIILHNVFSSPMSVYYACRDYETVQVVHDFKMLCPTTLGILLNKNYAMCKGFKDNSCFKCCAKGTKGYISMLLRFIQMKEGFWFRKRYVGKLLCPSQWLTDITKWYGFHSLKLNNLTGAAASQNQNVRTSVRPNLMSAGGLMFNKGVLRFAEKILGNHAVSLSIIGNRGGDDDYRKMTEIASKSNGRISYKGYVDHAQLMEMFSEYSFLVVPSLWLDNYPTIILEGMNVFKSF